jgi:hypothetical protein
LIEFAIRRGGGLAPAAPDHRIAIELTCLRTRFKSAARQPRDDRASG